jgi:hypothetical protein
MDAVKADLDLNGGIDLTIIAIRQTVVKIYFMFRYEK